MLTNYNKKLNRFLPIPSNDSDDSLQIKTQIRFESGKNFFKRKIRIANKRKQNRKIYKI